MYKEMCYLLYTGNLRGINVYNMKRTILLIILNLTILTSNSQNNILKDTIIQLGDYNVSIKNITKTKFLDTQKVSSNSNWIFEEECLKLKLISIINDDSVSIKLYDDDEIIIKKNEYSFSIDFIKYESIRGIYIFHEEWSEGGSYFMVSIKDGKKRSVYSSNLVFNLNTYMAMGTSDIISGWYSNGIQVYDFPKSKEPVELFSLDPTYNLKETWGVLEIKWVENNVILAKGIYDNWKTMTNDTIYKKIRFNNVR
jgi:hypothetical protein